MKRLTMVRSLNRCRCQPNVLPAQNAILYSMANVAGMPVYSKWITFPCNSRLARLQSRLQFQSQSLSPCSYLPANKYMCNAFITLQTNKCKCKCKCCCTILQSPLLCIVHTSIYAHMYMYMYMFMYIVQRCYIKVKCSSCVCLSIQM